MDFTWHLAFAFFIRICLICFAQWYDDSSTGVHYTDVDYTIFTNAAEHILVGDSPYMRPTYRYTPLIAVLLIPNVLLNCWGKLIFSIFDLATAIVLQKIVSKSHPGQSNLCAYLWLYNPLCMIISTRGNADSISCFLVLLTLYAHIQNNYLLSAICFATSVHVRIYPIIFGLAYYLNIDKKKNNTSIARTIFYAILPTRKKIIFVVVFVLSLIAETLPWYYLYGQKFLDESYLYHTSRLDVRHNFSVYFYANYLLSGMDEMLIMSFHSLATKCPLLILLGSISFKFSHNEELPFCLFCLTFVMVTFNTVLTSQYFVWFASFLPLCYSSNDFTIIEIINLIMIWAVPQIGWLAFAYCLEFLGINTFKLIWVESLMFFIANFNVLWIFIDNYKYNKLKKKL